MRVGLFIELEVEASTADVRKLTSVVRDMVIGRMQSDTRTGVVTIKKVKRFRPWEYALIKPAMASGE